MLIFYNQSPKLITYTIKLKNSTIYFLKSHVKSKNMIRSLGLCFSKS